MKKILFLLTLLISHFGFSQLLDPVEWTTKVEQINESEYQLTMEAFIEPGWHLYAQEIPEGGPIPTEFILEGEGSSFELVGATTEDEGHVEFDPIFEMNIKYFADYAKFTQRIKFNGDVSSIEGYVTYMVCDDSRCLPPTDKDLSFDIGISAKVTPSSNTSADKEEGTSSVDDLY